MKKSIVICGGASGIGLSIVKKALFKGWIVSVLDIDQKSNNQIEKKYKKDFSQIKCYTVDLCKRTEVDSAINLILNNVGHIDILVNNVGKMLFKDFVSTKEEEWDALIELNLKTIFYTCQAVIPIFKTQNSGNIINIASVFGVNGTSEFSCYAMTKAAVINLTKSLAGELAKYNIRVNAISPGIVMTPMLCETLDKTYSSNEQDYIQRCFPLTSSIGDPSDVADVAYFLASDNSKWITGHNVVVDGGYLSESVFTKCKRDDR